MGKARSKGARRRARREAGSDLVPLAPIPRREKDGHRHRGREQRDPSIETLKARCRHMGKPITNANLRDQRAPWWGCNAGRAIGQEVMPEADREAMWQAIQHMRRVIAAFDASIGAPKRHPACLRLLAPTDAMEADSSSPPLDTRTERERAVSAESALMKLEGWLGYADKAGASEAKRVVCDDQMVIDLPGLLIALRCVADGLKGKRLMYRGRDSTTC